MIHDDQDNHLLDHHHQQAISIISNGYEIPLADEDELDDHFPGGPECPCCCDTSSQSSSSNTISLGSRQPSHHLRRHVYSPSHHHHPQQSHFDHPHLDDSSPRYATHSPDARHHPATGDKKRTFSSSSTVSELSDSVRNEQPLCAATILKVALPNTKEDCSSDDALLEHHSRRQLPSGMMAAVDGDDCTKNAGAGNRLPTFYAHKQTRETEVLGCGESKTMM